MGRTLEAYYKLTSSKNSKRQNYQNVCFYKVLPSYHKALLQWKLFNKHHLTCVICTPAFHLWRKLHSSFLHQSQVSSLSLQKARNCQQIFNKFHSLQKQNLFKFHLTMP